LVLIDCHSEFNHGAIVLQIGFMIFKEFNDSSSELLTIFLFIHEEGTPNEVFRVEMGVGNDSRAFPWVVDVSAGVDVSIVDLDFKISLWMRPSPRDMRARTL
jgi:hypothetical protein